jgi:mRNA-degrading endonuclease toxin of MazEF toxin-antitoxin module
MPEPPRQGEVWLVTFQEGWERPAIVVSRKELNRGRLVLVVPCTSSRVEERAKLPNHVLFPRGQGG